MRIKTADAAGFIANLVPFKAGNLRGEAVAVLSAPPTTSGLPAEYAARLREAQIERTQRYLAGAGRDAVQDAPRYIVSSYGLPVAWVTLAGEVVVPPVTHTGTIARHQRIARAALVPIP
ncbi:hypothetical protein [Micromonospora sp. GCM10011541]|uniref:hypothetical protein n=1 Tax=Micromonospora sp. GCM10011541 TaxID=3317336 RepID=UPI003613E8E1